MEVVNSLLNFKNIKIYQNSDWFMFSLDSVLLAKFATIIKKTKRIADLGTGNAPIPIILSTRTDAHIDAVEFQEEVFKLASKSVKKNNLENQIDLYHDSFHLFIKGRAEVFDLVTVNPPYFKYKEGSNINKNNIKTIARHEVTASLEEWIEAGSKLLKNGGNFAMVHRSERLIDVISLFLKNNIEPKRLRFIHPKRGMTSNMFLIEGKKDGNGGLKILKPLFVHRKDGEYTKEILGFFEE